MGAGSTLLGFLAGILSILSPCVLPLLPVVLGGAVSAHRFGALSLGAGLVLSFTGIGLFVATIGFSVGLDADLFRNGAAILLAGAGIVLLTPALQLRLAAAAGPLGNWADDRANGLEASGPRGQFLLGLLLGAIWSPCVGPTLGAASVLAAQGKDLGQVAAVMAAFGIGAALPLVLIGALSGNALRRWRARMLAAGQSGKAVLGILLLAIGLLILSGADKRVEAYLVDHSPAWLVEISTRF